MEKLKRRDVRQAFQDAGYTREEFNKQNWNLIENNNMGNRQDRLHALMNMLGVNNAPVKEAIVTPVERPAFEAAPVLDTAKLQQTAPALVAPTGNLAQHIFEKPTVISPQMTTIVKKAIDTGINTTPPRPKWALPIDKFEAVAQQVKSGQANTGAVPTEGYYWNPRNLGTDDIIVPATNEPIVAQVPVDLFENAANNAKAKQSAKANSAKTNGTKTNATNGASTTSTASTASARTAFPRVSMNPTAFDYVEKTPAPKPEVPQYDFYKNGQM